MLSKLLGGSLVDTVGKAFSIPHNPLPELDMATLFPLVMALLGMSGIRSFEKLKKINSDK